MLQSVKQTYRDFISNIKESPIKFMTLTLKDKEMNERWQQEHRRIILNRTKIYIGYVVVACLLSMLIAFADLWGAMVMECCLLVTLLVLLGFVWVASKYNLAAVEFILPVLLVCRGIAQVAIFKHKI